MKITIFANGVSYGGAEHVACELANYFVSRGYNVDLITMADDNPTFELSEQVVRIPLIYQNERRGFIFNTFKRLKRIKNYVTTSDADCYIAMLQVAIIILLMLKKSLRAPVIVTERSNPYVYPLVQRMLLRHLAPRADSFIFQTKGQREFYGNKIRRVHFDIVPNAVTTSIKWINWELRDKVIVSAGRLHKEKNYSMLIKAFSKIAHIDGEYKLFIYGEGEERDKLEKQILSLNLQDRVKLPGFTDDLQNQMGRAKIFVLSSDFEGMPNALLEAMSLGLACISTDCPAGGSRDLIGNDKIGILVPTGGVDELADALKSLIEDDRKAMDIAFKALEVRGKYSKSNIFAKWEKNVLECVEEFEKGNN